ncbi:hypothetical protein HYH03_011397 [Edaphochlamys debaryana]|uniref:RING-CH-type domain-containing protein n=1 Tax=Edaphochlamys debaryana TaxID=47281 RepID=A0A836BUZ4_9CHLO|nr:hypothetical protein HYH03_011397 [Edaphochlamys debaryana]|eukprot:KAG2490091.1 hypothetical protein HYH03_011397 [Edaphochlamys debaryana]
MEDDTASTSSRVDNAAPTCRICWGEEGDPAEGLALVSPCKCTGSLNCVHVRCLQDWQQVLRSQGQCRKARSCEICKAPYKLPSADCGGGAGRWAAASQLASRMSQQFLDSLNCQSWAALAYRCWKLYILGSSVVGAARAGAAGLRAGYGMGKTLVEEQTGILLHLLGALGELLGTPYAELIWVQAVACVAFALLSEMVYTSVLGLVAGSVFGFFRGYMAAVHSSVAVAVQGLARGLSASRGAAKAAGLALRLPWAALRSFAAAAAKTLAVRIL